MPSGQGDRAGKCRAWDPAHRLTPFTCKEPENSRLLLPYQPLRAALPPPSCKAVMIVMIEDTVGGVKTGAAG